MCWCFFFFFFLFVPQQALRQQKYEHNHTRREDRLRCSVPIMQPLSFSFWDNTDSFYIVNSIHVQILKNKKQKALFADGAELLLLTACRELRLGPVFVRYCVSQIPGQWAGCVCQPVGHCICVCTVHITSCQTEHVSVSSFFLSLYNVNHHKRLITYSARLSGNINLLSFFSYASPHSLSLIPSVSLSSCRPRPPFFIWRPAVPEHLNPLSLPSSGPSLSPSPFLPSWSLFSCYPVIWEMEKDKHVLE